MKDEILSHLHDALCAAKSIRRFIADQSFDEYQRNELLRSAIERKFEVMGEALTRIRREAPEVLSGIRDCRDIISFRNILVHGYDSIDDRIVWGVIEEDLDNLIKDVGKMIS